MDRTTRSRVAAIIALVLACTGLAAALEPPAHPAMMGTFALLGGKPHVAAELTIIGEHGSQTTIDIVQTQGQPKKTITHYDIDMTKLMHMVVVRDDFAEFQHVHPTFNPKTGHFTETLTLAKAHRYFVYADTQPHGLGQQVFRFTLQPGTTATATGGALPSTTPSPVHANVGPYVVTLGSTTLNAQKKNTLNVTITKNGKPATGLRPYLGAAAHAVFIDTSTLTYVHVHPMVKGAMDSMEGMSGMSMDDDDHPQAGPRMVMHVPTLPVGTYKLWLQFQGGAHLYTAPFTLRVR